MTSPVVLVGLPRSGSTLLTRILNESPEHYVLNDLYVLQIVDKQNSWNGFSAENQVDEVSDWLVHMIKHRSAVNSPSGIQNSAVMTQDQLRQALEEIDGVVRSARNRDQLWDSLLQDIIAPAAKSVGKKKWGWNTPQDYHHIDKIIEKWPGAKIVFMLRDPRSMLKSYKYYPKTPASYRYHPLAQSLAWRNAARAWKKYSQKYPENLLLMQYEDLVADTKSELKRLNEFLSSHIPENLSLKSLGNNSSYDKGKEIVKTLTPMELWLSDSILYKERRGIGFTEPCQEISFSGVGGVLKSSLRFTSHYGRLLLTDENIRRRVQRFVGLK